MMAQTDTFQMVAKTLKGLEATLADELRKMGADDVVPGHRMVSFTGNLETLYRANLCLRTALRVLKPFYTFHADTADKLYDRLKEYDWSKIMKVDSTFAIDMTMNSDTMTHSRYATYRAKDAIVDWFRDRNDGNRPRVRLGDAEVMINIHIQADNVTVSLDSSGRSLHKRGWRVASTEAPINEVLAAGILLMSGYDGACALVDPMCGSGTFLVEAALIAANINPGVFRQDYAFKNWPDFDEELFDSLWNNEDAERTPAHPIVGGDILPSAVEATRRNLRAAGVSAFVDVSVRSFALWTEAPAPSGILVMNPPYGQRISAPDMLDLYAMIGRQLKTLFTGWTAWVLSTDDEYFHSVGLAPSQKVALLNGSIECQLREYVMFAGNKRDFRAAGGKIKDEFKRERKDKKAAPKGKLFGANEKPDGTRAERREYRKFTPRKEADVSSVGNEAVDENPFAQRRNTALLDQIMNRQPRKPNIAPTTVMRSRGWKKKQ